MNARQVAIIERLVLVAGLVAMTAAVASVDWRIGLFCAGLFLAASSIDLPWRRS